MRVRIRFGQLRFSVDLEDANPTLLTLKEAVCKTTSVRDVSEIEISLNGKETIDGDDIPLISHGLVSGDLVYVQSSTVPSLNAHCNHGDMLNKDYVAQLVGMGFSEDVATCALVQVNNTSVDAALEIITNGQLKSDQQETLNEEASTSALSHPSPGAGGYQEHGKISPVFCRDGVSSSLAIMFDGACVKTHHEALLVILHALMLESGFLPSETTMVTIDNQPAQQVMPVGWNKKSTSRFQYMHHLSPSIPCELVVTSLGPFICAHVWSPVINDGNYKVKLVVSHYVRGNVSLSTGARCVYQNLHKASRLVKDNLIHPFLATLRHYLGFTSPFSLVGLPPEIQLMIFSQLDAKSSLTLSQTCKGLHYISNEQKLWKYFCQRDFEVKESTVGCWKKKYKELYEHRQRYRLHDARFIPPLPYSRDYFNPFLPQLPPGIIGGPNDIFPDFTLHSNEWGIQPTGSSRPHLQFRVGQSSNRLRLLH